MLDTTLSYHCADEIETPLAQLRAQDFTSLELIARTLPEPPPIAESACGSSGSRNGQHQSTETAPVVAQAERFLDVPRS